MVGRSTGSSPGACRARPHARGVDNPAAGGFPRDSAHRRFGVDGTRHQLAERLQAVVGASGVGSLDDHLVPAYAKLVTLCGDARTLLQDDGLAEESTFCRQVESGGKGQIGAEVGRGFGEIGTAGHDGRPLVEREDAFLLFHCLRLRNDRDGEQERKQELHLFDGIKGVENGSLVGLRHLM